MIKAFQEGKDIYSTIASLTYNLPYEECLEFNPVTGAYQPDGKARRGEAKVLVLGINYGMSVVTIAESLFGKDDTMSQDDKVKKAQEIYDAVLNAFPALRTFMLQSQKRANEVGYTETILGRRRHIPDMQLPSFQFVPMKGYVNPDVDPLDPSTLDNKDAIPQRIIDKLTDEFNSYKYFGQVVKRTRELADEKIKVINNSKKIQEASRQVVNSIVQGSAAEMTKMALLRVTSDPQWRNIGGRIITVIHDEILAEVPIDEYEEASKIISDCMEGAGSFLPFPINCDVAISLRWNGLEYPCPYTEPKNLDNLSEDEIKWLQYMLCECEYILPVYKNEKGEKPEGDAAVGVNGIMSQEVRDCIIDYKNRYNIVEDQKFIQHIKTKVIEGRISK